MLCNIQLFDLVRLQSTMFSGHKRESECIRGMPDHTAAKLIRKLHCTVILSAHAYKICAFC